jgi:hypothetical protein
VHGWADAVAVDCTTWNPLLAAEKAPVTL